jgi:hypothetical protein
VRASVVWSSAMAWTCSRAVWVWRSRDAWATVRTAGPAPRGGVCCHGGKLVGSQARAVVVGVVTLAFPGQGHVVDRGPGRGQGSEGGPGGGVFGSGEILGSQPAQQSVPSVGVGEAGGENLAFGFDHRSGGQRRGRRPGPDPGQVPGLLVGREGVGDRAAQRGGDQRPWGSLGVTQPVPQHRQALLGLGRVCCVGG